MGEYAEDDFRYFDEDEVFWVEDRLCEGCPPVGYPTDETRCQGCPRAKEKGDA